MEVKLRPLREKKMMPSIKCFRRFLRRKTDSKIRLMDCLRKNLMILPASCRLQSGNRAEAGLCSRYLLFAFLRG